MTFYVAVNEEKFEYDVHSLVQAFHPSQTVRIANADKWAEEGIMPDLGIVISEAGADITFYEKNVSKHLLLNSDDFAEFKTGFKKGLYLALKEDTGKELPWGNLVGIRPTKIARQALDSGKAAETIIDELIDKHFVSNEKASLCTEIAEREKEILSSLTPEKGYSLYIGIPFCPTTCLYCSFTSYPICTWEKRVDDYLRALFTELEYVKENFGDKTLDTIYIGGGTPTSLSEDKLEKLLSKVDECFDVKSLKEYTVEAGRADSITREKLRIIHKHNVTRISVNPQTMKDETLKLIGRRHTVSQVIDAFNMAREEGIDNINMDIILGLPGETAEDVRYTIEEIEKLSPDNLTIHSLAIKRASRLAEWIKDKDISILNNTDEMMEIASGGARRMGMKPYYLYRQKNMSGNFENTGYALPGKNGIYNILIMEEVQSIVACGAGTVTKRVYSDGRIERCDNVKDVGLYINQIEEMIERKRKLFL